MLLGFLLKEIKIALSVSPEGLYDSEMLQLFI